MLLGGDQRRVGGREGGISQRLDVAQPGPQLLGDMRGEGGDHQHQWLDDLAR